MQDIMSCIVSSNVDLVCTWAPGINPNFGHGTSGKTTPKQNLASDKGFIAQDFLKPSHCSTSPAGML